MLDAGCGGGSLALAVARRHPRLEVEGVEMAPDKVAAGQAAGRKLAAIVLSPLLALLLAQSSAIVY